MSNEVHSEMTHSAGGGVPAAALFWLAVLLLFGGAMAVYFAYRMGRPPQPDAVAVADPTAELAKSSEWLTEFQLIERSGELVGSEDLRGKVWVANFFFSSCPGTCRRQTAVVSGLQSDYRDQDVRFVSISCDPKRDTPETLRRYAIDHQAPDEWWFLTGDLGYIRRVGAEFFRLAVSEQGHQDRLAVVDKWGQVRGRFNWHDKVEMLQLKDLIQELLAETEPPADSNATAESVESAATAENAADHDDDQSIDKTPAENEDANDDQPREEGNSLGAEQGERDEAASVSRERPGIAHAG